MKEEKEFLKKRFIEFQLKINELSTALKEQEQAYRTRERERDLHLFEILDAFENLNENIKEKEGGFDKTARILVKNIRSIQRKVIRFLEANQTFPLEFPDNMAEMEYCEVVGTKEMVDMENETILSVVKTGYIDRRQNTVLRKAKVITVLNSQN